MTVEECRDKLIDIRNDCRVPQEEILKYYCECMLKLERTFFKIAKTDMLTYIKKTMLPVFPLMVQYFSERAEAYKHETDEMKKNKILEDIETSVVKFWEVHEAIIRSSNGVDKILFQSAPIDTGQRYAAPKLCSFYSELLNSLAEIFRQGDCEIGQYAFCVYPTMNSQAEAVLLFTTMEKRGKIGIIRIPGKHIADIRYSISLLLHEFFHVIPAKLRNRKQRAQLFLNILLYDLSNTIIGKLDFTNNNQNKENFHHYLFEKLIYKCKNEINSKENDDRFFYSSDIVKFYIKQIKKELWEINNLSLTDMLNKVYPNLIDDDFSEYYKKRELIKEEFLIISNEISVILSDAYIKRKCRFYMGVFREAFSDLLAVMTMELSPEEYLSIFQYTERDIDKDFKRIGLFLRVFFVIESMKMKDENLDDEEFVCKWNNWKQYIDEEHKNGLIKGVIEISNIYEDIKERKEVDKKGLSDVMDVVPNKVILERYLEYFKKCRSGYLNFIKANKIQIEDFKKRFMIANKLDSRRMNYEISIRNWEEH